VVLTKIMFLHMKLTLKLIMACAVTGLVSCGNNSSEKSASNLSTPAIALAIPPPAYTLPNLPFNTQVKDQWCWAACGQMCMGYYGVSHSQCEQVARYWNTANPCNPSCEPACKLPDHSGEPEFSKYQFTCDTAYKPLSWDSIRYEIGILQHPLVHGFRYGSDGPGHFIVIYGYMQNPTGMQSLLIYDPHDEAPVTSTISYKAYVGSTDSTYWEDFANISKI
jgi:hypothetical protein